MNSEKQNYVITYDTTNIVDKVVGKSYPEIANSYNTSILNTFERNLKPSDQIEVKAYLEKDINQALMEKTVQKMSQDPESICICLDRFLLSEMENSQEYQGRFFRLGMSRMADGTKVPRQGFSSFRSQLEKISSKIPDISQRKVVLVDDGFFTGGTVQTAKELLKQIGVNETNIETIGFINDIEQIPNLMDWVDLRDVSFLGGRIINISKSNRVALSEPYIFPWSDGKSASLDNQNLFAISQELIQAQKELVSNWENVLGRKITFRDLIDRGFPLPYSRERKIKVNTKMNVSDYLDQCLQIVVESEKSRQVIIFDMDGTLYQLDGENNGYSKSTLETKVNKNIIQYITNQEQCSLVQAQEIFNQAISDPVGASQYLSARYQITRSMFFDTVWNIDPKDIVKNYNFAQEVISSINPKVKLILLTSAPKIWAEKVLTFLGIKDKFETIYSGEDYKFKTEIFQKISRLYQPENITSVGDQEKTDIQPAADLGFKTLLIKNPQDISLISYKL
jgi:FMN phosphatase YigB (HAD superfamily)